MYVCAAAKFLVRGTRWYKYILSDTSTMYPGTRYDVPVYVYEVYLWRYAKIPEET